MNRMVWMVAFLAACSAKPAPADDFSDLAGADVKSDSFSYRMRVLGEIWSSAAARYTPSPRYRAWTFTAGAGDQVDAWVRSTHGDAVAWILDGGFHVLASNDDADDTTYDSHLVLTIPAGARGPFYLVFRDYNLESHDFTASLSRGGNCAGEGLVATVPDECMDDGGGTSINDSLEVYCVSGLARFCLSGEDCPWRNGSPATADGATCSRAGLDTGGENFMAHAWCSQYQGHEWYVCGADSQISFDTPPGH